MRFLLFITQISVFFKSTVLANIHLSPTEIEPGTGNMKNRALDHQDLMVQWSKDLIFMLPGPGSISVSEKCIFANTVDLKYTPSLSDEYWSTLA